MDKAEKHKLLSPYFKYDETEKCAYFIGDKLEVFIPKRYQGYGVLEIADTISTLAIFEMRINEDPNLTTGYFLPAVIQMEPVNIRNTTEDGTEYVVLEFEHMNKFITRCAYMGSSSIGYVIWREFVFLGHMPRFITYEKASFIFDAIEKVCGLNFQVPRSVKEMIMAHSYRDAEDINLPYRLTDMLKPPVFIGVNSISFGPDNITSKIGGSYASDGINANIVNQSSKNNELEDLLNS